MKKIFIKIFLIFLLFQVYSFFPVIFHKSNLQIWSIEIYDRNQKKFVDKRFKDWYYKKLKFKDFENSRLIKNLVLIEDKRFYTHFWVDILSKIRAFKQNIISNWIVSWWSTITEQFIKNRYFLKEKRSYLQKFREANLAFFYSIFYSKEEILEKYLNTLYLGNNIYWIQWAVEKYFWKYELSDLTDSEINILIALIKYPWITSFEETYFVDYKKLLEKRLNNSSDFSKKITKPNINIDEYPFITNEFLKEVDDFYFQNYTFNSTIDLDLQNYSFDVVNNTVLSLKDRNVTNGALLAINPWTFEILAYHPSRNYSSKLIDGQVNILKMPRQLWSTFKPFLYLQALKSGFEIDDLILDVESQYNLENNKVYISQNYSMKEYWLVRLKKALWNSLNSASVRLAKELWLERVYDFYTKFGFKFDYPANHYWLWLVLWNAWTYLQDLVVSYSHLLPYYRENFSGNLTLDITKKLNREKYKIDENKFLLYNILSSPDNRDISFWVESILNTPIPQAVKTGTSSDFRDNVIMSYHPDFVMWIWVGNNDNSSMKWVTGITWAWYIYNQVIKKAIQLWLITDKKIEMPENIYKIKYCLDKTCFRSEATYKKSQILYKSAIADNIFSKTDLKITLDEYEENRLKQLWVRFEN